ncbi:hypothetical protein SJDPG11_07035 [Porphyromonas gingivalis SJD11]|nr:hypothetical protein SJDPG11_07035 [Porphyromonas gingivalis SJD11]
MSGKTVRVPLYRTGLYTWFDKNKMTHTLFAGNNRAKKRHDSPERCLFQKHEIR